MNTSFQIEFYLKGDAIDLKSYDVLPNIPAVGDEIYLECENPNMNSDGCYYKVIDKRNLFFSSPRLRQKVMIKLEAVFSSDW